MPWISAGLSLAGGLMQSDAAGDAAGASSQASDAGIAEQRRQYEDVRRLTSPYRDTGDLANTRLQKMLGLSGDQFLPGSGSASYKNPTYADVLRFEEQQGRNDVNAQDAYKRILAGEFGNPEDVFNRYAAEGYDLSSARDVQGGTIDPEFGSLTRKFSEADLASDVPYQTGLKFGLDQGTQAINNRAVASGGYDSGATLKALTRFANDYGSTKAGEASNRDTAYKSNVYGMLSGQQNVGMNANNTLAGTGQNTTNAITGLMTDKGDADAAGIVGKANSMASAFGGISST